MSHTPHLIVLKSVDSTQLELKRRLRKNPDLKPLTAVFAHTQTDGKGRGVSMWHDEERHALLLSVFIKWPWPFEEPFDINRWFCSILADLLPDEIAFKWPNDLMVGTQKLGGMLIENHFQGNSPRSSILGIGINVRRSDQNLPRAISLDEVGFEIDPLHLAHLIIHAIHRALQQPVLSTKSIRNTYHKILWGKDQWNVYTTDKGDDLQARVQCTTPEGQLVLRMPSSPARVFSLDEIKWQSPH